MPFVDVEGGTIHWDERGSGSPILLIMGHSYDSHMWYPVLDDLSQHHRLIWFDNRGTGRSTLTGRLSVEGMVRDAGAVLDAAGVDRAHVYGASMGGGIALEMGRTMPERVRSLLLGCTMAKTPDVQGMPVYLRPLLYLPPPWVRKLVEKVAEPNEHPYGTAAKQPEIDHDVEQLSRNVCPDRTAVMQTRAVTRYSIDPDDVRAMEVPALVLHGTEDRAVPYEAGVTLSELLPDAEMVTFEGAGHNYFVAYKDEANTAALRFLEQVDGARVSR